MTIYTMYFSGLDSGTTDIIPMWSGFLGKYGKRRGNTQALLAQYIKKSENNSFVFITTKNQKKGFDKFLENYKLNNLIVFQTPDYITNPVHLYNGRSLKITVLQTEKHFVNDLFDEAEEMFNLEEKEIV